MFLSWLFDFKRRIRTDRRKLVGSGCGRMAGFQPRLERLEDRTVLSTSTTDPATHFLVLTPRNVYDGVAASLQVVALDASNHVARNYSGTVQITSTDSSDKLPTNYTFKASDHGVHSFKVTAEALGSDAFTATDTTTSSITDSATVTVNPAPVATHFLVVTRSHEDVGELTSITVIALDASNHPVRSYSGTVQITSTVAGDVLPANYTFQASDHGSHTFQLTPKATGTDTITATDTASSALTGSVQITVNPAPVATHFVVEVPRHVTTGVPTPVLVVVLDASNHVVPTYTGTVQITSSDTGATLPANYTFQGSDFGAHVFMVTFASTGSKTITATDTGNSALTNTVTVNVGQSGSSSGRGHGFGGFGGGLGAELGQLASEFGHSEGAGFFQNSYRFF
jgi:hypothetical protein